MIAVVNEDTIFLALMEELLSEEGYNTYIEKAGDKAYASIAKNKPDLVVLDIRLNNPEAGFKVIDLVRLNPETAHIPIIICSTVTHLIRDNEARLREKNCDVLLKPFHLDELLTKVQALLGPAS
ncbi:MAG TPA: response regulator [Roseiflexaceae bacterium]|nr:response regulator [Roseiflexaceae bacterium]